MVFLRYIYQFCKVQVAKTEGNRRKKEAYVYKNLRMSKKSSTFAARIG